MAASPAKIVLQGSATLSLVMALYAGPLILSMLLGVFDTLSTANDSVIWMSDDAPREAVVWIPPQPEIEEALDLSADDPSPAQEPTADVEEPTPVESPVLEVEQPGAKRVVSKVKTRKPVKRRTRRTAMQRAAAKRRMLAARAARASRNAQNRTLSAEEQRKRDRRVRKAERRAERKQCAELIDQIIEVDDDTWWVGREVINCYRTHPEQFVHMGGAWWNEIKGKKRGVRVHVSSKPKGDVARRAGFRKGDVVRSINGIPINSDMTGALAATQLLRGRARVKIERGGEPMTFRFKVVSANKLDKKLLELAALAEVTESEPAR